MNSARLDGVTLIALATLLIGYALQVNNGTYTNWALGLLIAGTAVATIGLMRPTWILLFPVASESDTASARGRSVFRWAPERGLIIVLLAGLAANLLMTAVMPPGISLVKPEATDHPLLLAGLAGAAIVIGLIARDRGRARWLWFPLLLVIALALGLWMIDVTPSPIIDVLTVHKYAIAALRAGHNPYSITFPNIYQDTRFYGEGMTANGQVLFGLPYPPLSLLMALPGQLWARDIRYAELAAVIGGAALIAYAPRVRAGAGVSAIIGPLAAAALLFMPRTLFMYEQGWTEPFMVVWLGAVIFAACRAPRAVPWMLALLVAVKQHMVLAMPLALLLLPRPFTWRAAVRLLWPSLVVPALFALPFLIWNPQAFLRSVVWLQLSEPFRPDALSVLSALHANGWTLQGRSPITLIAPLAGLAVAYAVCWRHAPRTPAGFAVSVGFVYLLFFVMSKKAFCNYYFFVISAFAAAIAAYAHDEDQDPSP